MASQEKKKAKPGQSTRTVTAKCRERTEVTHKKHLEEMNERPPKILLIGDSLLERWKTSGKEIWEQSKFLEMGVQLAAVGGDATQHVLWRLENGLFEESKGSSEIHTIGLLIGTNNLSNDTPVNVVRGICEIVKKIQEKISPEKTKIIIFGILPRTDKHHIKGMEANKLIVEALKTFPNVSYHEFDELFLNPEQNLGDPQWFEDQVHLNTAGYARWIGALVEILKKST